MYRYHYYSCFFEIKYKAIFLVKLNILDKLSIYYNHYQITVFCEWEIESFFRKVAVKQFEIVGLEIGELMIW